MISGVDSLVPLTHLAHPPSHNPSSNPQFVLHVYESFCFVPLPVFILCLFPSNFKKVLYSGVSEWLSGLSV